MSYEAYRRALTPVVRSVYRVEVRGEEKVPLSGRLVVAGNHDSMLDPFLLAAVIPRPIRYLAKAELWKVPGLAWWLGTVEAIPLIVSSILSKKLAAGLGGLVMDVKHGSGAFMAELDDARALARALVDVAVAAGLPTVGIQAPFCVPGGSGFMDRDCKSASAAL